MVKVENLSVRYNVPVLENVSFSIPAGETRTILGPSGCGKTTLIYTLAGLRKPFTGRVLVNNDVPLAGRRETAVILQDYGLLPWKTVRQNVGLGLVLRGVEDDGRVDRLLESLGLSEVADSYPSRLSGGQRQRVAIGRALAVQPELLLMDEPFSALDAITREELQELFLSLWQARPMTTLLVTHSIEEAVFLGQRILIFSERPGTIVADIPNPTFGDKEARHGTRFYELCIEVRRCLEAGQK